MNPLAVRVPGVYRYSGSWSALRRELTAADWSCATLDGTSIRSAGELFDACARALRFPGYFGRNWDALFDLLRDPEIVPAPGALLWERADVLARADPTAWRMAGEVLTDAITTRKDPLYAVIGATAKVAPHLPDLAAT